MSFVRRASAVAATVVVVAAGCGEQDDPRQPGEARASTDRRAGSHASRLVDARLFGARLRQEGRTVDVVYGFSGGERLAGLNVRVRGAQALAGVKLRRGKARDADQRFGCATIRLGVTLREVRDARTRRILRDQGNDDVTDEQLGTACREQRAP